MYADGTNPREIAAGLNAERVPPGQVGIAGRGGARNKCCQPSLETPRRGVGILNNELYIGRVIWNQFRWVRSVTESKRRRCVPNPERDWVVHTDESLRIVPQDLCERLKARQRARSESIRQSVRQGVRRAANRTERKPSFLFSGLLKCGGCGANFVMSDRTHYSCEPFP